MRVLAASAISATVLLDVAIVEPGVDLVEFDSAGDGDLPLTFGKFAYAALPYLTCLAHQAIGVFPTCTNCFPLMSKGCVALWRSAVVTETESARPRRKRRPFI